MLFFLNSVTAEVNELSALLDFLNLTAHTVNKAAAIPSVTVRWEEREGSAFNGAAIVKYEI